MKPGLVWLSSGHDSPAALCHGTVPLERRRGDAVVTASATIVWVSLIGAVSRKAAEQEIDSGQLSECLTRLDLAFIVLRQPPSANQPGKTPFNHPSTRLDAEAARARRPFDDLKAPTAALLFALSAPVGRPCAAIGSVCPDLLEPRHEVRETSQESASALRVRHICGRDVPGDGRAQRIDQEVALPAFDELAAVKAADGPRFLDGLHALAVHDGRTRVGVPANALALGAMQHRVESVQGILDAKLPEVIEHRLPRWEIDREIAPLTTGAQDVEDCVENTTQWMGARPATAWLRRPIVLRGLPLGVS